MGPGGGLSWLICQVGSLWVSLPLSRVGETMRPLPLRSIPNAAPFDCGEATIRGQPTPVYDLGLLAAGERSSQRRWVTLKTAPRPVALAVDAVHRVKTLAEADTLQPLLATVPVEGDLGAALREARRLGAGVMP
ncbi:MAG: chemotaxis protein CheW [Myxococcaceae bacterium]